MDASKCPRCDGTRMLWDDTMQFSSRCPECANRATPMSADEIAAVRERCEAVFCEACHAVGALHCAHPEECNEERYRNWYRPQATNIPRLLATIDARDERIAALEKLGERFASVLDHEGDHFGAEEVRDFLGAKEAKHE